MPRQTKEEGPRYIGHSPAVTYPAARVDDAGDRGLSVFRDSVKTVFQSQAVPVNRRRDVTIVSHMDGYLGSLIDVQRRTRNGSVVCEHPQFIVADAFADGKYVEIEFVAIAKTNDLRPRRLRQPLGVSGEKFRVGVAHILGLLVLHLFLPHDRN